MAVPHVAALTVGTVALASTLFPTVVTIAG